ncbi:MAG: hypothetical protein GX114_09570 [Clostridiales bacterium]|nr:hypothetical protein [Clostridiales bacterium]
MNYYNLIKSHRNKILIGFLVIFLLGNFYLISKTKEYQRKIKYVAGEQYIAFFSSLRAYGVSLKHFDEYATEHNDIEREIEITKEHVNNLVSYARFYGMLAPEHQKETRLSAILWQIAIDAQKFYEGYLLNENKIKENTDRIGKFSIAVNEIVEMENSTRIKALGTREGFNEEEMADILYPKMKEIMDLTGLYDERSPIND